METPNIEHSIRAMASAEDRYGTDFAGGAEIELVLLKTKIENLKMELEHLTRTYQKVLKLAHLINVEMPADSDDQMIDELGKQVLDIVYNRLRNQKSAQLDYLIQHPATINELLQDLHTIAIADYNSYAFGLPMFDEGTQAQMREAVLRWLSQV